MWSPRVRSSCGGTKKINGVMMLCGGSGSSVFLGDCRRAAVLEGGILEERGKDGNQPTGSHTAIVMLATALKFLLVFAVLLALANSAVACPLWIVSHPGSASQGCCPSDQDRNAPSEKCPRAICLADAPTASCAFVVLAADVSRVWAHPVSRGGGFARP